MRLCFGSPRERDLGVHVRASLGFLRTIASRQIVAASIVVKWSVIAYRVFFLCGSYEIVRNGNQDNSKYVKAEKFKTFL